MRFLLILLFCYSTSYCQTRDSIFIEFEDLELLNEGWQGKQFYFKINKQVFSPTSKTIKVALNNASKPFTLENFYFSFDSLFTHTSPAKACFFYDSTYIIRINPCSQYELYPKNNRRQGILEPVPMGFNTNDTVYLKAGSYATDTLHKKYKPKKLQLERSIMCSFAPVRLSYFIVDENGIERETYSEYIHFLHGEIFRLLYKIDGIKGASFIGFNNE